MNTWIQQMGFPLVTIIREDSTIIATQKRFLSSPRVNISQPKSSFDYKWYIPLNCYTDKDDPMEPPIEAWMNMTNGNNNIIYYIGKRSTVIDSGRVIDILLYFYP